MVNVLAYCTGYTSFQHPGLHEGLRRKRLCPTDQPYSIAKAYMGERTKYTGSLKWEWNRKKNNIGLSFLQIESLNTKLGLGYLKEFELTILIRYTFKCKGTIHSVFKKRCSMKHRVMVHIIHFAITCPYFMY